jgi:hypothetical protein
MGVKEGLAYRRALLDFMEQPTLEGSRFSANPKIFRILWNPNLLTFSQEPTTYPYSQSDDSSLPLLINNIDNQPDATMTVY